MNLPPRFIVLLGRLSYHNFTFDFGSRVAVLWLDR